MGVDAIGWRPCLLQRRLGEEEFRGRIKLDAYRRFAEHNVSEERRATFQVRVRVVGSGVKQMSYRDIVANLGDFPKGIPECPACPLSDGRPIGCYRYVTYPIHAEVEQWLFDLFVEGTSRPGSAERRLYEELVTQLDGVETSFHDQRGRAELALVERDEPLEHRWVEDGRERRVDSAQLLTVLFHEPVDRDVIAVLAAFWRKALPSVKRASPGGFGEVVSFAKLVVAIDDYDGSRLLVDG